MDGNGLSLGVMLGAAVCVSAAVLVLPGCGETKVGSSHEAAGAVATGIVIRIPDVDQLHVPLTADGFDASDFMVLGGCDLQATLGKYQSSLGRRASDSQRLLLDLEYLLLAPQCIEHKHTQGQTELATLMVETQHLKRKQLPTAIFNATLASAEFQQLWHKPATAEEYPAQQQLALRAMQAVNRLAGLWLSGDYRASNIEFEIYLSEIALGAIMLPDGHDREAHGSIVELERQLDAVLTPKYLAWRKRRNHYFAGLETLRKID
ncbi:MAG: DUF3080 family protein [Proteobacteria bacterium]|nr:DUF3080 family protein [Pseudomonadota bacterium]